MKNKKQIKSSSYLLFFLLCFNSCAWWEKQKPVADSYKECGVSQAPFIVGQIENSPNYEAVSITHGTDGLIKTFTLNLKACLRDYIRQDNPIQNIPFTVEYYKSEEDKQNKKLSIAKPTSNSQGCIQWQEEYNYKYTAKPLWIRLDRTIRKEKGSYAGAETIPMAVNPWLSERDKTSGFPYILDTRCEYSKNANILNETQNYEPNGLKYLSKIEEHEKPLLWVPDIFPQMREISPKTQNESPVSIEEKGNQIRGLLSKYQKVCVNQNSKDCYRRQIEMNLYIPLKIRTLDKSGLRKDPLLGGSYNLESQLIISPKGVKDNYRLHENICSKNNIEFNQTMRSLILKCILNFSYFNQNALYKLVIRIKPYSDKLPFKTFEGVYSINLNFQDVKQNLILDTVYDKNYEKVLTTDKKLNIIENMDIKNISDLLLNSSNNFTSSTKSNNSESKQKPFIDKKGPIKSVSFYRLHLDGYGEYKLSHIESGGSKCSERENVVERTAVFVGKLCLKDVLSSQQLNNTPFRVFLEKPKEGSIEEKFYLDKDQNKKLFKTDGRSCISVPIPIKHKIFNRQKYFQVDMHVLSEELNLYGKIRLALSPWQRAFQAFQDAQNLPEKDIRFDTKGISKPELVINQFRSINLFPSYGLDKLLNIHLFHRFYLLFQPFIRRPDNLAFGLDFRARELLRDGHYLVRVLVLRNPQEAGDTGNWSRAQSMETLNMFRNKKAIDQAISLKDAQYITHTDSVVKAKANFVNFYMPLYLSTKQFYYIASRNFIAIEIHPADPNHFVYKDDQESEECVLDMNKTVWKPFKNHELETSPYVGAFNIQQWVNWNLLQPVKDLNMDEIIEKSDIGKKYKHFNFSAHSDTEEYSSQKNSLPITECTDEIYEEGQLEKVQQTIYNYDRSQNNKTALNSPVIDNLIKKDVEKCHASISSSLNPGLEAYRNSEEKYFSTDILKNFSQKNSLKLISLSDNSSNNFIQDIQSSFEKYQKTQNISKINYDIYYPMYRNFDIEHLLTKLPEEDKNLLEFRMDKMCTPVFAEKKTCSDNILKAYLTNIKESLDLKNSPIKVTVDIINNNELLNGTTRS
ncbi:MAG: hypothetical protein OXC37_00790, partial [Bdellovibrionaceae bacterium]|nr:hypothetical protein [Pseudobdellovibrionaceae bacterium]